MKHFWLRFLFQIFLVSFVFGQSENQPFSLLDKQVKEQNGVWRNSRQSLSKLFSEERIVLSDNFETELWKYLGDDTEKYYWTALFLDSKAYLNGTAPLPELALAIRQRALQLLQDKKYEFTPASKLKFLVTAAVAGEKLGKKELAALYKKEAEIIINANPQFKSVLPKMTDYKQCLYENIGGNTDICRENETLLQTEDGLDSAEVAAGKFETLSQPEYPKKASKKQISGTVTVKVLINEQGNVISAKATEGPKELREAAEKAALQSKFTPTTLYGKPVKVQGVIVYNFVPTK
ncbi:MAG: energy transducer TonB [Pyrinomonadaceae bacterium]